jgi:hypothetical protein
MKVYLFEKESGLYLGEDFDSGRDVQEDDGKTVLPPPVTLPGEVPVFLRERCWRVVAVASLLKTGVTEDGHG